jgi:hypothetical protein
MTLKPLDFARSLFIVVIRRPIRRLTIPNILVFTKESGVREESISFFARQLFLSL